MNVNRFAKERLFWCIFEFDDGDDLWVVHCLDLDVVTQGQSLTHACAMLAEAVDMSLKANPTRRPAPRQDWERLWGLLQRFDFVDFGDLVEHGEDASGGTLFASVFVSGVPAARAARRGRK